jgi:hypothetical protein
MIHGGRDRGGNAGEADFSDATGAELVELEIGVVEKRLRRARASRRASDDVVREDTINLSGAGGRPRGDDAAFGHDPCEPADSETGLILLC